MKPRAALLMLLTLTLTITLVACHPAPKSYTDLDLATPQAVAAAAAEHWAARDGHAPQPAATLPPAPATLAIMEFNVQYVKEELRSVLGKKQAVAGVHEFSMVGGGLNIIGIGRHQIRFDETLRRDLPSDMYAQFVAQLAAAGYTVLPTTAVTNAPAYRMAEPAEPGSGDFLMLLNLVGGDTGRLKQFEVWPAVGLPGIKSVKGGDMATLEQALLDQTGADAVIRAQFRVGTYDRYAAVEGDSIIELAIPRGETEPATRRTTSQRSLVGAEPVVSEKQFKLLRGDVHTVDSDAFRRAISRVFPVYTDLGITTLQPAGQPPIAAANRTEEAHN